MGEVVEFPAWLREERKAVSHPLEGLLVVLPTGWFGPSPFDLTADYEHPQPPCDS